MRLHSGILLLDKPLGVSSAGAVRGIENRLKWVKCGHIGTLDPQATGLLVVLVGNSVKMTPFYLHGTKRYTATICFGKETETYDSEGQVVNEQPVPLDLPARLSTALEQLVGEQQQIPPIFSAIKQGGKRLFEMARQGKPVEAEPRTITFHELTLQSLQDNVAVLDVRCSSGTYIRSLAHDLGAMCGTCAYLAGLRRTESLPFKLENALSLDQLCEASFDLYGAIVPLETYPPAGRYVQVEDSVALKVLSGKAITHPQGSGVAEEMWTVYTKAGELIAMAQTDTKGTELLIRRVIRLDVELPEAK